MDFLSLYRIGIRLVGRLWYGRVLPGGDVKHFRRTQSWWMGNRRLRTVQTSFSSIARTNGLGHSTMAFQEKMKYRTRQPKCGRQEGKQKGKAPVLAGAVTKRHNKEEANTAETSRKGFRLANSSRVVARILTRADHGGCEYYCSEIQVGQFAFALRKSQYRIAQSIRGRRCSHEAVAILAQGATFWLR